MTDRGQGAAGAVPEPDDESGVGPWSSEDLAVEGQARELMSRLSCDDDGEALVQLIELLDGRLERAEPSILDELGSLVPLRLGAEWFSSLLMDQSTRTDGVAHPLAAAYAYMQARGRNLLTTLSAQPLPWEDGYQPGLPAEWMGRLEIEQPKPEQFFVTLVSLHRLPETTRQVLRDLQVSGLEPAACAEARGLSVGEVERHFRDGRLASLKAIDRYLSEGGS